MVLVIRCKLLRFFWLEQWGNISCSTPKYTPLMGPRRLGRLLMTRKVCSAPRKQFAGFWDAFCLCMKVFTKSCKKQCLYTRVHVNYQKETMTRRGKKKRRKNNKFCFSVLSFGLFRFKKKGTALALNPKGASFGKVFYRQLTRLS